jgi:hypothetical protein
MSGLGTNHRSSIGNVLRRCARPTVLALVCMSAAWAPVAAYTRYLLWELAAYADVVATGEIVGLDDKTFEFQVAEAVVGTEAGAKLQVKRFENWTCHGRWAPYAVGQRLMVFLQRSKDDASQLRVMGGGDEGELPFVEDDVVAENSHSFQVRGFEVGMHLAAGKSMKGTRLPAAELSAAVIGFKEAFKWTRDREVSPREGLAEVESFAATSKIARHMAEEAASSRGWHGPEEPPVTTLIAERVQRIVTGEFPEARIDRWSLPGMPSRLAALHDSRFGESLALPGDIDGDGLTDLVVGAPRDNFTGHANGAVWLMFLERDGRVRSACELRDRIQGRIPPMNEFAQFGAAVASLGDLDGNAVPDFAVGAPGWDGVREHQGGIWVVFMEHNGDFARAVEISASPVLAQLGVGKNSGVGASIASLGDLDHDGTLEVAIGQDPQFDFGLDHGRAVYVVSLATDGSAVRASRIHGREDGFEGAYWFGDALCAIGDVNGDGVTDLAVADSGDHDGGDVRGAVWVIMLAPDGSVQGRQKISDWHGEFEGRLVDWSRFGLSVAGPGDVDHDGVPDLLVGSAEGIWTLALRPDGTVRRFDSTRIDSGGEGPAAFVGRSLAVLHPARAQGSQPLAAGGSMGKGPSSEESIWWLQLSADGRLVER